jgi:hypothetical protein
MTFFYFHLAAAIGVVVAHNHQLLIASFSIAPIAHLIVTIIGIVTSISDQVD